jgi:hypothetical protein
MANRAVAELVGNEGGVVSRVVTLDGGKRHLRLTWGGSGQGVVSG